MSGGSRTHRPQHNEERCLSCGGCTWHCPASVFPGLRREEGSLRAEIYSTKDYPGEASELPPCTMACPLGQDVPAYIKAIAEERFEDSAAIVRRTNALPSVCGRLCVASCMRACTRNRIDVGLDIRGLKRFAVEAARMNPAEQKRVDGKLKVAVVGAGPAGLAAAHLLLNEGIAPVVFDAGEAAGGSIRDTVPGFAMPDEMLAGDVRDLEAMGVEIRTGVRLGADKPWLSLEEEFDAVLVATGARRGLVPALKGRDLENVTDAPGFNRARPAVSGMVVVSGGGAAALQSARTALRLGAKKAAVIHPAPREQWPAGDREIALAEHEGVEIHDLERVESVAGEGAVKAVMIKRVQALSPDGVDRHTLKSSGKAVEIPCDHVIFAVDRRSEECALPDFEDARRSAIGSLIVDDRYRLARPRWYAAGEAATGAATVVDSMGTGRRAARAIVEDLREGGAK